MLLSKGRVASHHSGLDLHVRTVLFLLHSHDSFADFNRPSILSCVDLRECVLLDLSKRKCACTSYAITRWSAEEPETSIYMVILPTLHLFISFAVAFSPIEHFWSVCECICAEYPRTVGILTSDDGRKLRNVDT